MAGGWCDHRLILEADEAGEDKAGNCLDPDEEAAASQLEIWLQTWSRRKDSPKDELELLPHVARAHGPPHCVAKRRKVRGAQLQTNERTRTW